MADTNAPSFGNWFVEQRRAAKLTQDEVAAATGIHKVTISRIENGKTGVSKAHAITLAGAVHADVNEALLRADWAPLGALEPELEEEREVRRLLDTVPAKKRRAVLKAWQAVTEAMLAA